LEPNEARADASFAKGGGGVNAIVEILKRLPLPKDGGPEVHLVGHSAGAILLGHMLDALSTLKLGSQLASVQLMAPACRVDFFAQRYRDRVGKPGPGGMARLSIYNLTDKLERDDTVFAYQKSLLYLISNAFESERGTPLLGMEVFSRTLELPDKVTIDYATEDSAVTESRTHGGFDNDFATMNTVLKRILGKAAPEGKRFKPHELEGY
jgi:hypothetical protein